MRLLSILALAAMVFSAESFRIRRNHLDAPAQTTTDTTFNGDTGRRTKEDDERMGNKKIIEKPKKKHKNKEKRKSKEEITSE